MSDPKCLDCGKPYSEFGLDMVLPRSQWLEINPGESGLLCAQCIVNRASRISRVICVHAIIEIASVTDTTIDNQRRVIEDLQSQLTQLSEEVSKLRAENERLQKLYDEDTWTGEIQRALELIPKEFVKSDWWYNGIARMAARIKDLEAEVERMKNDIDRLRVQLAGCGVAALGGTSPESIAKPEDWGWSPAYQSVLELRRRHDNLETAIREEARLRDLESQKGQL